MNLNGGSEPGSEHSGTDRNAHDDAVCNGSNQAPGCSQHVQPPPGEAEPLPLLADPAVAPIASAEPQACSSEPPPTEPQPKHEITQPIFSALPGPISRIPFENWAPIPEPPVRVPNFGHLSVLALLVFLGLLLASVLVRVALRVHLFGISSAQKAMTDIHYTLGSEVILYLFTFIACLLIFPFIWHRGFFQGIHWNGATAIRKRWWLFSAATVCFVIALLNGLLLPGPQNAPIDKIFRAPGAAWLLFAFGTTFAPFFEELFFRGFLLPAFCTACDWVHEHTAHVVPLAPDENDHPRWSLPAMLIGSVATSIPFALLHAAQTGYSVGPLILLVGVSLVLCWARLSTRSLAASVLVHASYNFLLFSFMMLGTEGFRHLDKM